MTCTVGVVENGVVWMGADAFSGNEYIYSRSALPKVFTQQGVLFGIAGDWRGGLLLQSLEMPAHPEGMPPEQYVGQLLVAAMRDHFREHGFLQEVNAQQQTEDLVLLIGYQGRLFALWQQFQLTESAEGYEAIGSGMFVATGALYAARQVGMPAAEQIHMALTAACAHSPFVRPPFRVLNERGYG